MAKEHDSGDQKFMPQFMTTEHFVLQTARSATIQEANQRANLFLTAVSSATIALAFVAQVTKMGQPFMLFSMIVLPCLYFIGLVTFLRAVQVAVEDMVHARGMARIRHYFLQLAPDMKPYLVHATHDDELALLADADIRPTRLQSLMSTAAIISATNGAIAGTFTGIVARVVAHLTTGFAVALGVCAFAASVFLLERYHTRTWHKAEQQLGVRFPGAPDQPSS